MEAVETFATVLVVLTEVEELCPVEIVPMTLPRPEEKKADAQLLGLCSVDACKADLQQNLRISSRNLDIEQVHNLARCGSNLDCPI